MRIMTLTVQGSCVVSITALGENPGAEQEGGNSSPGRVEAEQNQVDAGLSWDPAIARVTAVLEHDVRLNDHVSLRKGARLIGYLTARREVVPQVTQRLGDSLLAIVLDRTLSSDGLEVPIQAASIPAAE